MIMRFVLLSALAGAGALAGAAENTSGYEPAFLEIEKTEIVTSVMASEALPFDSHLSDSTALLAAASLNSVDDPDGSDCSVTAGGTGECTATSSTAGCSVWNGDRCSTRTDEDGGGPTWCSTNAVGNAECSVGDAYTGRGGTADCSAVSDGGSGSVRCSVEVEAGGQSCSSDDAGFCSASNNPNGAAGGSTACSVSEDANSDAECSSRGNNGDCSVAADSNGGFCSVETDAAGTCTVLDGNGSCSANGAPNASCSVLGGAGPGMDGKCP